MTFLGKTVQKAARFECLGVTPEPVRSIEVTPKEDMGGQRKGVKEFAKGIEQRRCGRGIVKRHKGERDTRRGLVIDHAN